MRNSSGCCHVLICENIYICDRPLLHVAFLINSALQSYVNVLCIFVKTKCVNIFFTLRKLHDKKLNTFNHNYEHTFVISFLSIIKSKTNFSWLPSAQRGRHHNPCALQPNRSGTTVPTLSIIQSPELFSSSATQLYEYTTYHFNIFEKGDYLPVLVQFYNNKVTTYKLRPLALFCLQTTIFSQDDNYSTCMV